MTDQELRQVAAQAWERTKAEDDPPFALCTPSHQSNLAYKVKNVVESGTVEDIFDREAYAVLNPPAGEVRAILVPPLTLDVPVEAESIPTAKLSKPKPKAGPNPKAKAKAKK